jgi:hypothetical protein
MSGDNQDHDLDQDGFTLRRGVFGLAELPALRAEADRVALAAGSACVRRLGERSPVLAALARSPGLLGSMPSGMRLVRSILFDKTPDENWPVAWHQDTTIAVAERREVPGYGPWSTKDGVVHVQPLAGVLERMITLRVHLDDTPTDNGALWVIPGSHLHGRLPAPALQALRDQPGAAWVCACAAGDVLILRPLTLHASSRAAVPARRRVLHYEYAPVDALDARLTWAEPEIV